MSHRGGGGNPLTSDDDDSYPQENDDKDDENNTESEEITYTYKTYYDYFIDNMDCTGVYDDNGNLTNVTISAEKKAEILSSDFTGSGTSTDPYQVNSSLGFWFMSKFVTLSNKYVELNCDVILNDETFDENGNASGGDGVVYKWSPIGNGNLIEFNGNNHVIKGLYINTLNYVFDVGLFGNSTIKLLKNTKMENTFISAECNLYAFCGTIGKCENCVSAGFISGRTGGVYGFAKYCNYIKNCENYTDLYDGSSYTAGIAKSVIEAKNCKNFGKIVSGCYAGGLFVYTNENGSKIENCDNYGDVHIFKDYEAGGIVANVIYKNNIIRNCNNYGQISSSYRSAMGGITGDISGSYALIENCCNYGKISATADLAWMAEISCINGSNGKADIINCKAMSHSDVPFVTADYVPKNATIRIENSYMECDYESRSKPIFKNYSQNELIVKNFHLKVLNSLRNNKLILCDKNYSSTIFTIKNVYIECENGVNISSFAYTNANLNGVIIKNSNGSGYYYGSTFSGYYISWRTGKIGLKALDGVGYFQGAIDEEWLGNNGFVKKD